MTDTKTPGQLAYEAFHSASLSKVWTRWEDCLPERQAVWEQVVATAKKRQPPKPKGPAVTVWWVERSYYDAKGNSRLSVSVCSGEILPQKGWRQRVRLADGRIINRSNYFKTKRKAVAAFIKNEISSAKSSLRSAKKHERLVALARKL